MWTVAIVVLVIVVWCGAGAVLLMRLIAQALQEIQTVEAENLANGMPDPITPPVDALGVTEPKHAPHSVPLRNLAAADIEVAGPRMGLQLWSSLLVLARCSMDDVVIASFPDTPEGMERAIGRAREVIQDPSREWNTWQANDSEFLKCSVARVTDGGSMGLMDFFLDEEDSNVIHSVKRDGRPELVAWTPDKGGSDGRTIQETTDDSAVADAAAEPAPSGADTATAAGS